MVNIDLAHLNQWLGKEEVVEAVISVPTANQMNVTLNREPTFKAGDELPPAWHWLYFHETVRADGLGIEGHPKLGGFMPPVSFGGDVPPRRMWAGGTLDYFERPIRLGDHAVKRSRIKSITPKQGRSGRLCFVIVEHEISVDGVRCLREEQTIVYREPVKAGSQPAKIKAKAAPTDASFSAAYTPDPILLFRYSALTFNGHRIHYDVDFCRDHEGYPNLVVHGPLIATLLLDLFYHQYPNQPLVRFDYRARSPLFNPHPFTINGKRDGNAGEAWAGNHEGGLAMKAKVIFK
ncbi:MAG: FAS1-like dehydratase domain-containing protein [Ardenticatenaceae bacterium]